ncbi:class II glutamine amidotransferase [Thermosipho atlanticus]|uniref:class II glutamine amidotransferase n=1 Tax=Thermosipho atlanticus TaxID=238991 RepID=UPI0022869525|nr:class II glutamine amidotransferase [Thermosipho atlanticus]
MNQLSRFNCIFSDGDYLFCYFDEKGYSGLYYVQRSPPFSRVKLVDEDFSIDLLKEKKPGVTGYVIATKVLTDEK